jgi:hypothetical protein
MNWMGDLRSNPVEVIFFVIPFYLQSVPVHSVTIRFKEYCGFWGRCMYVCMSVRRQSVLFFFFLQDTSYC